MTLQLNQPTGRFIVSIPFKLGRHRYLVYWYIVNYFLICWNSKYFSKNSHFLVLVDLKYFMLWHFSWTNLQVVLSFRFHLNLVGIFSSLIPSKIFFYFSEIPYIFRKITSEPCVVEQAPASRRIVGGEHRPPDFPASRLIFGGERERPCMS